VDAAHAGAHLCAELQQLVHCDSTLKYLENRRQRERYRRAYHVIGWFMAVFPITGVVLASGLQVQQDRVYWMEAAGIWAFAAYWLFKTFELRASQAEVKAVQGTLSPPESD
jgi:tellurite resistance protein TehA-like permease